MEQPSAAPMIPAPMTSRSRRSEQDGVKVLSFEQAVPMAKAEARGDSNAAADRPVTISEAIDAYGADLVGRGRSSYNAAYVKAHLPAHLAAQPLSMVTSKQLRHWRDSLIKGGMLPASINRMLKGAIAAFNLAAKLDKRIAANREAWKVGLEALPNAVTARDAVLSDKQVLAVVAASYQISEEFGLYVQVHAETGSRSSQLARCTVGDLHGDKLMIPASRKGKNGGRGGKVGVPLTPALAERLRRAATGRARSSFFSFALAVELGGPSLRTMFTRSQRQRGQPSYRLAPRSTACGIQASGGGCGSCRSGLSPPCTIPPPR
jgi:integrase